MFNLLWHFLDVLSVENCRHRQKPDEILSMICLKKFKKIKNVLAQFFIKGLNLNFQLIIINYL